MNSHLKTHPSLSRPATHNWIQLLSEQFRLERLPRKVGSRQLWGSRLEHSTSSDINSSVNVMVHELHSILSVRCTHQCEQSSKMRPSFRLLFCQRSVLFYILRASLALFHLDPLKRAPQLMVHTGRLEIIYQYCDKTVCTFLVRSRRWSRCAFFGRPSRRSVCYYENFSRVLLEGAQLIDEVGECTLFPIVQAHTRTSAPEPCVLFSQLLVMSSANFHEFLKSFKVLYAARQLADRFQKLLHSCVPCLTFLPLIHYSRFSAIYRSREL
jgi:hypothetical protein